MLHRFLRTILPFLYIRNWYNGQFELSLTRLLITLSVFFTIVLIIVIIITMGQPIVYHA